MVQFIFFPESRRLGKTVMIAKNIKSKNYNSSTENIDESCSDEESADDSMDGHPVKKKKIN